MSCRPFLMTYAVACLIQASGYSTTRSLEATSSNGSAPR